MKEDSGIWLRKVTGKGVRFFKRDLLIFAFFLILSFVLWYLNSLKKEIELDIRYPVKYINPPGERIVTNDLPSRISMNLKGPGYSIIKLKISGNRAPLTVDFSKVTYKKMPGRSSSGYYIVSSSLIQNFSRQLRSEFQITSVEPDTLYIEFGSKAGNAFNN